MTNGTVPWRVDGLLAPFVEHGVLAAADVHVARRLTSWTGEQDDRVALAVALTVRALRSGSVCLVVDEASELGAEQPDADTQADLDLPWPQTDDWNRAIRSSPLVADGPSGPPDRPVRWVDGRVYLDRYWRDELLVRRSVAAALPRDDVDTDALDRALGRLFPGPEHDRQRQAVVLASERRITVLTGGPGTGKTTTVARLVAALVSAVGSGMRVGLAAPTGKAAARLQEAVNAELRRLDPADQALVGGLQATTVHRLLGWRWDSSTRFRHDRSRPLHHDLVVIDESSMVSLPLMARVMEALRPGARLVLVGDADQLVSVEAGAVLGDLVDAHPGSVVRLTTVHRYGHDLAVLAEAIRTGDADTVMEHLRSGSAAAELVEPSGDRIGERETAGLRADVVGTGEALVAAARAGDAAGALTALGSHRVLVAHRSGRFGVSHWARVAEQWVHEATGGRGSGTWPVGTPLLVTQNDRVTGLYNGDTGVVVADGDRTVVVFGSPDTPRRIQTYRLPVVQPVHAMTIHRAQGSQFSRVTVLLPPDGSALLTRELLYTAVTRAASHVRVIGSEAAIRTAVGSRSRRASGLRAPLG